MNIYRYIKICFIVYIYFCFQTQPYNKGYYAFLVENINSTPFSLRELCMIITCNM